MGKATALPANRNSDNGPEHPVPLLRHPGSAADTRPHQTTRTPGLHCLIRQQQVQFFIQSQCHERPVNVNGLFIFQKFFSPSDHSTRPYLSSSRTISSSPRYDPDWTSMSSRGMVPGFSTKPLTQNPVSPRFSPLRI
jgi:hypothetical protein